MTGRPDRRELRAAIDAVESDKGSGGMTGRGKHPSASDVQQVAEKELLRTVEIELQRELGDSRVHLETGCPLGKIRAEVDEYCEEPPIMCEIWAHLGSPKGAQYGKVMMDALKMIFIEKHLDRKFKKILVFADEKALKPFCDSHRWQAKCLRDFDIECKVAELQRETRERLQEAQKQQALGFLKKEAG